MTRSFVEQSLTYLTFCILIALMVIRCLTQELISATTFWPCVLTFALALAATENILTRPTVQNVTATIGRSVQRFLRRHGWRLFASGIIGEFAMLTAIAARPRDWEIGPNMLLPFWGSVMILAMYISTAWILFAEDIPQNFIRAIDRHARLFAWLFRREIRTQWEEGSYMVRSVFKNNTDNTLEFIWATRLEIASFRLWVALLVTAMGKIPSKLITRLFKVARNTLLNQWSDIAYLHRSHRATILTSLWTGFTATLLMAPEEVHVLSSSLFWMTGTLVSATICGLSILVIEHQRPYLHLATHEQGSYGQTEDLDLSFDIETPARQERMEKYARYYELVRRSRNRENQNVALKAA